MKRLAALCLLLLLSVSIASSNNIKPLSPQEIVNKMMATYETCTSYIDEGQVSILFMDKYGNHTLITPFSTAFVRPSEFRFKFKTQDEENKWNHYIISMQENNVKAFWSINPDMSTPPNLNAALGRASAISRGSSITVPSMRMSEVDVYKQFTKLEQLQLVGEEPLNDKIAYKIEGIDPWNHKMSIWIDKETLLLIKIFETNQTSQFATESTTTYKPMVNVKVAEEKLAFDPTNTKK
jgi:hypothetical protein